MARSAEEIQTIRANDVQPCYYVEEGEIRAPLPIKAWRELSGRYCIVLGAETGTCDACHTCLTRSMSEDDARILMKACWCSIWDSRCHQAIEMPPHLIGIYDTLLSVLADHYRTRLQLFRKYVKTGMKGDGR